MTPQDYYPDLPPNPDEVYTYRPPASKLAGFPFLRVQPQEAGLQLHQGGREGRIVKGN